MFQKHTMDNFWSCSSSILNQIGFLSMGNSLFMVVIIWFSSFFFLNKIDRGILQIFFPIFPAYWGKLETHPAGMWEFVHAYRAYAWFTELARETLETLKHYLHPDGSPTRSLNIRQVFKEAHRHKLYMQQNVLVLFGCWKALPCVFPLCTTRSCFLFYYMCTKSLQVH